MPDDFAAWWEFCQSPDRDGHANDSADDGAGLTRWGWTLPTWLQAWRATGGAGSPQDSFSALTQAEARAMAQTWFWGRLRAPRMAAGVDVSVIDWAWTSGYAITEIQSGLGVRADGIIGPVTLGAMKAQHPVTLVQSIYQWRSDYYQILGFKQKFPGLFARAAACRDLALRLA